MSLDGLSTLLQLCKLMNRSGLERDHCIRLNLSISVIIKTLYFMVKLQCYEGDSLTSDRCDMGNTFSPDKSIKLFELILKLEYKQVLVEDTCECESKVICTHCRVLMQSLGVVILLLVVIR